MAKQKKVFIKKVEWKEGNMNNRMQKIVQIILLPFLIWVLWTNDNNVAKFLITIWLLIWGIESIINIKWGKKEVRYEEV